MLDKTREHATPGPERGDASDHERLRVRAAWLYHVEGMTQSEVATVLGVNRVMVNRLLAEARRRGEVMVRLKSELAPLVQMERELEARLGVDRVLIAPFMDPQGDPTQAIAAIAGRYVSSLVADNMTIGVGWGRTLHSMLPYIDGKPLKGVRIVSLLGGIAQARRFNPAEFSWQFAELFEAEGFLVPAPAIVDSPQTKHALIEHCGLNQVFELAESSDLALISCGGISNLTTSYRLGHLSEAERSSLIANGAVGDVLYNFLDESGAIVDNPVNERCVAMPINRLLRVKKRVLISGGPEKHQILKASLAALDPHVFITDEQTALRFFD